MGDAFRQNLSSENTAHGNVTHSHAVTDAILAEHATTFQMFTLWQDLKSANVTRIVTLHGQMLRKTEFFRTGFKIAIRVQDQGRYKPPIH